CFCCLAVFFLFPLNASAAMHGSFLEMVEACERVILEQNYIALKDYPVAPFNSGLPGRREYSNYDQTRQLVVIARLEGDRWSNCSVAEKTVTRANHKELFADWEYVSENVFSVPPYSKVTWPLNPTRPMPGAVRGTGNEEGIVLIPGFIVDWTLSMQVTRLTSQKELCAKQ
ncbi:MAG: hypothetical protein AAFQ28_11700, partial [Pseudomonadota bacterium]